MRKELYFSVMLPEEPLSWSENFTCLRFKATLGSQSLGIVEFFSATSNCVYEWRRWERLLCVTNARGEQWSECSSLETDSGFNQQTFPTHRVGPMRQMLRESENCCKLETLLCIWRLFLWLPSSSFIKGCEIVEAIN